MRAMQIEILIAVSLLFEGSSCFTSSFSKLSFIRFGNPALGGSQRFDSIDSVCKMSSRGSGIKSTFCMSSERETGGQKIDSSIVDKVASKGIWQFGALPDDAQYALAKSGWIDSNANESPDVLASALEFSREDIEDIVQRAVSDETFVDDRSKQMFSDDMREKLLKTIVRKEVREQQGVDLEDLLNPIKVISLEGKILKLEAELQGTIQTDKREKLEEDLQAKRDELAAEKRAVMRDWLKTLFRGQAAVSLVVGGALSFNSIPFVDDVPIAARALGFWTMWLFTIPSLRAVKPLGLAQLGISAEAEKKALNLAFVLAPLLTLILPLATKDPGAIFSADALLLASCYMYYKVRPPTPADPAGIEITGVLKYLDYGSGRERGARK